LVDSAGSVRSSAHALSPRLVSLLIIHYSVCAVFTLGFHCLPLPARCSSIASVFAALLHCCAAPAAAQRGSLRRYGFWTPHYSGSTLFFFALNVISPGYRVAWLVQEGWLMVPAAPAAPCHCTHAAACYRAISRSDRALCYFPRSPATAAVLPFWIFTAPAVLPLRTVVSSSTAPHRTLLLLPHHASPSICTHAPAFSSAALPAILALCCTCAAAFCLRG